MMWPGCDEPCLDCVVMFAAIALQCVAIVIGALLAAVMVDWTSARFFALGGAAAMIPNGLFALRLALHRRRRPESYPAVFFLGEFAKIGLTVLLLAAIARTVPNVRWLPLLLGFIVALKVPLFALLIARDVPQTKPNPSQRRP